MMFYIMTPMSFRFGERLEKEAQLRAALRKIESQLSNIEGVLPKCFAHILSAAKVNF